jgi:beta-galactosidase
MGEREARQDGGRLQGNLRWLGYGRLTAALLTAAMGTSCFAQTAPRAEPVPGPSEILYGAAYYSEYEPYDRLDQDIAMMKKAGLNVVRMGESTWSLWEPEDGKFEYAWMDRVVDAMGKAGIKVIMGTPTYSIPTWMYREHPEILVRTLGGGKSFYGMRQNMDTDNADYRRYAKRVITNMVEHYKDNPYVIGWQLDNETASYGAANDDVVAGFTEHLKKKFGTTDNLNKRWFLNYWGEDVNGWENLPSPDKPQSTGYKLEWARWEQMRVTDFLAWQADLVRQHRGPKQFVTTDYGGMMKADVNEYDVARHLDVVADNIYHGTQDHMDGWQQAIQSDYSRSLQHTNFLVTETNAQTTDWSSSFQYPPYDGQLRLDVYTHLANGANMVEYWHWASIHSGQETYWKGVLSHDLEPNRAYAEVSRTGNELKRIGPELANLKLTNDVAILWSSDSLNALSFMPIKLSAESNMWGQPTSDYAVIAQQMHRALYDLHVGADFVFPQDPDFSHYKLLVVPPLYIADDALLEKISDYVKGGGHVLMCFKSGFANEDSAVRWVKAPGPLHEAAGFTYQEFSNLEKPLALRSDPFGAGADNKVSRWAEFLMTDHAEPLAWYDHSFFGRWPAITRNQFGSGTLTYEGTYLSDALQQRVMEATLKDAGIERPDAELPGSVHARHGVNGKGKQIDYYLNYSSEPQSFAYPVAGGVDLPTGKRVAKGERVTIAPWDVVIVEE